MVVKSGAASDSERPFSLDTTKDKLYNGGSGSSSVCPRRGSMLLESRGQERMIVNTSCNTWRCVSCRDRNMRRFKAKVQYGVSTLGLCMFITITYKQGVERLAHAGCVARDWRAFWRVLYRKYPETKKWGVMRVMELTKKGTPHFHLIAGKVEPGSIACYRPIMTEKFFRDFESCECWSHRMSRVWKQVQKGESYIVHTIEVSSALGAAAYIGKYLQKQFSKDRGAELGMSRRYSANRAWPSEPRARIKSPGTDGWRRVTWEEGEVYTDDLVTMCEFEKKRTDRQQRRAVRNAAKALLKQLGRSYHGS